MRIIAGITGLLSVAVFLSGTTLEAQHTAHCLQAKVAKIQVGILTRSAAGHDSSAVLEVLQRRNPHLTRGNPGRPRFH